MKITYLGTAASEGWPAFFCGCDMCREAARRGGKDLRMRSGAVIDEDILMDLSPDVCAAHQRLGVDLSKVRHALVTHWHADHFSAESVHFYASNFVRASEEREKLTVYGAPLIGEMMKGNSQLSRRPYGKDWVEFKPLMPFEPLKIDADTTVTALPAHHSAKEGAYVYMIERSGKRLLYLHDTESVDAETMAYLSGKKAQLISMDATAGPATIAPFSGHMCFQDNLRWKEALIKIGAADGRTVFISNHICIHACQTPSGKMYFYDDLCEYMKPHGFLVSYDGMRVEF